MSLIVDGISPALATILPQNIKESIIELMNQKQYPDERCRNLLQSIKRDGHTFKDHELQGIAIGPFFSRVYDMSDENIFSSDYWTTRKLTITRFFS